MSMNSMMMMATTETKHVLVSATSDMQIKSEAQKTEMGRNLRELFESRTFCDLSLVSNIGSTSAEPPETIECHKVILAGSSSYFKDLLHPKDTLEVASVVNVSHFKLETVREAVMFIYTGECNATINNLGTLLKISQEWDLKNLSHECLDLMKHYITNDSVIKFYETAMETNDEELIDHTMQYIGDNFLELKEKFTSLSLDNFYKILRSGELNVDCEDSMFKVIVHWVTANPSCENVVKLYDVIEFERLSKDYICDVVMCHPLMQASPQVQYVRSAIKYYFKQNANSSPSIRKHSPASNNNNKNKDNLATFIKHKISMYSPRKKDWTHVISVPKWLDECSAVNMGDGHIVLAGANHKQTGRKVVLYDLKTTYYPIMLPDLPTPVAYASIIKTDQYVHLMGGQSFRDDEWEMSRQVLRISVSGGSQRWKDVSQMPHAVSFPMLVHTKEYIYVLGGYDHNGKVLTLNQIFDRRDLSWTVGKEMPKESFLKIAGAVVYKDKILVLTTSTCMTYDKTANSWQTKEYKNMGNSIKPVIFEERIYACITDDDKHQVKSYNYETNKWKSEDIDLTDTSSYVFFFSV